MESVSLISADMTLTC